MKRATVFLPVFIGIALALGIFIGSKLNFNDSTEPIFSSNSKKDKLNRLIDYIDFEYVDNINTDSIVDVTVNGILNNLDPHSVYIPSRNYSAVADDMRGKFVGIGVNFYMYKDTVSVISTAVGGPAQKAGIKGGDRILYAGSKQLFGDNINRDSISNSLKGELNSSVQLKVYRKGEDNLITLDVQRKEIPIKSVDASYMINETMGFIKVNRFAETTYEEFEKALKKLISEGMESLVLDLRDNPGGYVFTAEKMVEEFLKKGSLIMMTKNKVGVIQNTYSRKKGIFEDGNVYVLVNEMSASASEIVAGALQDNDKGIIIGRRTYGKGLVQREMNLGDGSAVRLTVARYYTPTGRSIQRPYENGDKNYFKDYQSRYEHGELVNADSISVVDSLRFETPKGKIVYGGGGIIPDYFVPKDVSSESESMQYVVRSGYLSYFVFEYLDKNRLEYEALTLMNFDEAFEVSEKMVKEFIVYSNLKQTNIDLVRYNEMLKKYLKATIAQQLFGEDIYEKIIHIDDPMIQKAVQLELGEEEKE